MKALLGAFNQKKADCEIDGSSEALPKTLDQSERWVSARDVEPRDRPNGTPPGPNNTSISNW